jgi:iron-sulfur cluster insertion protein
MSTSYCNKSLFLDSLLRVWPSIGLQQCFSAGTWNELGLYLIHLIGNSQAVTITRFDMTQTATQQAVTQPDMTLAAADLSLTPAAREKMSELFSQVDDADLQAIRVFVSGGGCGGMGYGMTFTDSRSEFDYVRKENGFSVYVDAVALNFLRGVEIDYVERPTGASFVFNNAFALTGGSGTCGACGAAGGGCA